MRPLELDQAAMPQWSLVIGILQRRTAGVLFESRFEERAVLLSLRSERSISQFQLIKGHLCHSALEVVVIGPPKFNCTSQDREAFVIAYP